MCAEHCVCHAAGFEQAEAQKHRVAHRPPDRAGDVAACADSLYQHRIDAHAYHNEKCLKRQCQQRFQVILPEALRLINAWGFQYKTVAFVWLKRNRKNPTWFYGLGYWTRGNAEICLLATKGKPKRQSAGVHQFIISPIEQHSKKPDEARQKILALMGDLPRLELFARQKAPGWDVWGNEIASDITLAERRNDGLCECAEGLEQD